MKHENMKLIGLTGGVGSGKSTVSAYLSDKGYPVLDADKIAREIVAPGGDALKSLVSVFGLGILNDDGSLDRKKLAGMVFHDSALKDKMDGIMHGEILKLMRGRIDDLALSGHEGPVFLDIPLLFEVDAGRIFDMNEIWLVDADDETRVRRVTERDGISRQAVLDIMGNQMSGAEKRRKAHKIIDNSGSKEELYRVLDKLIDNSYE